MLLLVHHTCNTPATFSASFATELVFQLKNYDECSLFVIAIGNFFKTLVPVLYLLHTNNTNSN